MSILNKKPETTFDPSEVFADPVAYLAEHGLDTEIVTPRDEDLPAAA